MKKRYVDPAYTFQDRLYFLFGTAGTMSAGAAFFAAIFSQLPQAAAIASLISLVVMLAIMITSFFNENIVANRIFCSIFLNFFMFPSLFWVTGGVDCGMIFYFLLGLCVTALILEGKMRMIILVVSLIFDSICIHLGFMYPEIAIPLSYEERHMDTLSSFAIVAIFIIAAICIQSVEYRGEHAKAMEYNKTLQQQVNIDDMTTLFNQRYLLKILPQYMHTEAYTALSIAMFDIDHFKQVNDNYGHLRGNNVLCRFASILKEEAGEKYIPTRYGGEEFIVVLPNADAEECFAFADKVRKRVENDAILRAMVSPHMTISGGIAQYEEKYATADEFIQQADDMLYLSKERGRNQITAKK